MHEAIMLWDKVLDSEERRDLVINSWSISDTLRTNPECVTEITDTTAENMCNVDLDKLYQAMTLSPRTMYFKRKLTKIEKKIEIQWNQLRAMYNKKTMEPGSRLEEQGILPRSWAMKNYRIAYAHLSFTVKHLLRASYNPDTNRFEPILRFGIFNERGGV
jgi:hypothetical protein